MQSSCPLVQFSQLRNKYCTQLFTSYILSLCSALKLRDNVSRPWRKTVKIIILNILGYIPSGKQRCCFLRAGFILCLRFNLVNGGTCWSETSVPFRRTKLSYIPEDRNICKHRCENLKLCFKYRNHYYFRFEANESELTREIICY
jgi:hypothetical protein